nr:MAG TPA: hypothetical protein [Caudoviricetes sp.]
MGYWCAPHHLVVRLSRYIFTLPVLSTVLASQPSPFHPCMHLSYHYDSAQLFRITTTKTSCLCAILVEVRV